MVCIPPPQLTQAGDMVQLLSSCLDERLLVSSSPILRTLQSLLSYSRVSTMATLLGNSFLLAAGGVILLFFMALALTCYLSARAIQQSRVPNMMLVRFIRLTLILVTTIAFIPCLTVVISLLTGYATENSTNLFVLGAMAVLGLFVLGATAFVALATLTSYAYGYTSANPLARLHSRIDVFYLLGKALIVLIFQIPPIYQRPALLRGCLLVFALGLGSAFTVFIPYYRMITNILRVASMHLLVISLLSFNPVLFVSSIVLAPFAVLAPCVSYFITELPTARFRRRIIERGLDKPEGTTVADLYMAGGPRLLFPFQVEIALRHTRREIKRCKMRIDAIERRTPMGILEYHGAVSDDGNLNPLLLPRDYREELIDIAEQLSMEVDVGIRLYQYCRARWPTHPMVAMSYVLYTACYRGNTLQSAINTVSGALAGTVSQMDVRYFHFICLKYRNSLQEDSSVMEKLEAQRNMNILLRSQRKLADALGQFWALVIEQKGMNVNLKAATTFIATTRKINLLLRSTERLYDSMLKTPNPRVLRAYGQYVLMFNDTDAVQDYLDALFGVADELEVVHFGSGRPNKRSEHVKVDRMDLSGASVSFIGLHIQAAASVVIIALLFTVAFLFCILTVVVCRHISWQVVAISAVVTGLQDVSLGLSNLRAGSPVHLIAASQYIGPMWATVSTDMGTEYITAALGTYNDLMNTYAANGYVESDPYGAIEASQPLYDAALDRLVSASAHLLYNVRTLLEDASIVYPTFSAGVRDGGQASASAYDLIAQIVHTTESVAECLKNGMAAGTTATVVSTACTADIGDTLLEFEHALVSGVTDALYAVGDEVFISAQLFPVLEMAVFSAVFTCFIGLFMAISVVLYVVPVSKDISFTIHVVSLFSAIPLPTAEALKNRFLGIKAARIKRTISKSNTQLSMTSAPGSRAMSRSGTRSSAMLLDFNAPDTAEDDGDGGSDRSFDQEWVEPALDMMLDRLDGIMPQHQLDGSAASDSEAEADLWHEGALQETGTAPQTPMADVPDEVVIPPLPIEEDVCLTLDVATGESSSEGQTPTGSSSDTEEMLTEFSTALLGSAERSNRSLKAQSSGSTKPSLLQLNSSTLIHSDSPESPPVPSLSAALARMKEQDLDEEDEDDMIDAHSLAARRASMASAPPAADEKVHESQLKRRAVQLQFALGLIPGLLLWVGAFGLVYLSMALFALIMTGDVSQNSESIYYQYRSMLDLRRVLSSVATAAWTPSTAPTTVTEAVKISQSAIQGLSDFASVLAGHPVSDIATIDTAWAGTNPAAEWVAKALQSVVVRDGWMAGAYEADIGRVLFHTACIRLHAADCDLTRRPETTQGALTTVQTYLVRANLTVIEISDGAMFGPSHEWINDTLVYDVSGAMIKVSYYLRQRFVGTISSTQTNALWFMAAFVVLLALFYTLYLFRSIKRMASTRRQFSLLFRALPRNELPSNLTGKFLRCFPDSVTD
ncbi:tmcB-like protein [Carpediemonas membranifera]|uniref:TmcB-like protein n=1 Tax=Carpediemonas membranifera TaxID=201153 RepID=A0A8J6E1R3_9EUKA|nr:tmcB-like protein [Carpediemonas membranifera]|eukprot:KAG9390967.1 tmcB-like protein [Carpediemonas membranifera]